MNKMIPNELDRISDRQDNRGAKIFFRALGMLYADMARQIENGRDPQPNEAIIKNALISYHSRVAFEMATWQYEDLAKRNPIKALQVGIQEIVQGKIKTWIALNIGKSIKSITDTSLDRIKKIIADGQENGYGARKLAQQIREESKSQFTAYRATVIARTEGTRAASQGAKFGAEQWESITGQQKWKAWSASTDSRTRDQHLAMVGTPPIPGDQDFIVGGTAMDGPGDPAGGKANIINCRCRRYYMSERMARKIIAQNGGIIPANVQPVIQQAPIVQTIEIPKKPKPVRKPKPVMSTPVPDNVDDGLDEALRIFQEHEDGKEAIRRFRDIYDNGSYDKELTLVERAAINNYTSNYFSTLNKFNRGVDINVGPKTKLFLKAHTKVLNYALDKFPDKYVGTVYRGMSLSMQDQSVLEKYKRAFKTNTTITEEAFMSTSYNESEGYAGTIKFNIKSKTGSIVEKLSQFKHEKEVLFKAGQQFKVTNYINEGGYVRIDMEEL